MGTQIIFVGDFVDRGPEQRDVLHIAKRMCEAGEAFAVMGNHEFNALGWAESDGNGDFLRLHTPKNREQHQEFLDQIGEGSAAHREALEWFRTLPVWLDLPGLRVVHACWHSPAQRVLEPFLDLSQRFTPDGLRTASRKGSEAYVAAEILLKGPEASLPDGRSFRDKQGHIRHEARLRWWDPNATTLRKAALGMDGDEESPPDLPMTNEYLYTEQVPVFFGHYWLKGVPTRVTTPRVLTLASQRKDFSRPIDGPERGFCCRTTLSTRMRFRDLLKEGRDEKRLGFTWN
jgi:hypothetical protein